MRNMIHSYEELCSQENNSALSNNSCYNAGKKSFSNLSVYKQETTTVSM